jgi:mevalonate kinase
MTNEFNSKILLFGEYAVLHKGMALVMPCEKYTGHFEFLDAATSNKQAVQSNEYLKKFCNFVANNVDENFVVEVKQFEQELEKGLFFKSNIPQGYGLGSSGALVAAIALRYLKKTKNLKDEIKALTYNKITELKGDLGRLESYFHGVSSGIDPLSIILNEPILLKNQQEIITTTLPKTTAENNNIVFLIDSKQPRNTSKMMSQFNTLLSQETFKKKFENHVIYNNNQAIEDFLNSDVEKFYKTLYNLSEFQFQEMKDFFPENLHQNVAKGLKNGDYLLKICGAGGGGFTLGFTQNWEKTKEDLKDFELEIIHQY